MQPLTRPFVVLGLAACLCAPGAAAQTADCSLFDRPGDRVTIVGLTGSITPANAPVPGNDSERLLFRQVYDTLVRVACDGRVRPALASSWQLDDTRAAWLVTVRQNARFSDGTAVTAQDVIASWTRGGVTLAPDAARIVRAATAVDDHTLAIVLQHQEDPAFGPQSSVGQLAHPALAIARTVPDSPWPLGTRELRLEGAPAPANGGRTTITLAPVSAREPASPDGGAVADLRPDGGRLRFLLDVNAGGRDLLDGGVDLLVTRDPSTLAYGSALGRFDAMPLPWSRSYIFLSRASGPAGTLTAPLRQQLAFDAVPGEAQGSSLDWPVVWDSCTMAAAPAGPEPAAPRAARLSGRIVFAQTDAVARALAERIVALNSTRAAESDQILAALIPGGRSRALQTASLPEAVLPSALARGEDAGYVIAIDRSDGCAALTMLREQAPWMSRAQAIPLVDTRSRALVRTGRAQLVMEWDGSLLIGPPSQ
jgi:hypothetical protein